MVPLGCKHRWLEAQLGASAVVAAVGKQKQLQRQRRPMAHTAWQVPGSLLPHSLQPRLLHHLWLVTTTTNSFWQVASRSGRYLQHSGQGCHHRLHMQAGGGHPVVVH